MRPGRRRLGLGAAGLAVLALVAVLGARRAHLFTGPPPPQAWWAGLGMRDLEVETSGRLDDAVARGRLDPARAAALKARVAALRAEEQGHRTAGDFTQPEFDRITADLLSLAAQAPDLPLLHPVETPPAHAAWTHAHAGAPLDLAGYRLSFEDPFERLDIAPDGGQGRWYAPVHTSFGEAQFQPPGPGGPFRLAPGQPALEISATRSGDAWRSGLMQTLDGRGRGFAQQYGYFEMRARLPRGQGTWPGFWLLTQNGLTDPSRTRGEIDVMEQYGSSPGKIHATVHLWPASARAAGGVPKHWYRSDKITVGDMASAYHRYGAMLTPDWVILYYDGRELSRFPMLDQYRTPVYMLVDLAMHKKGLAQATSPSVLTVDYVRAYTKAAGGARTSP